CCQATDRHHTAGDGRPAGMALSATRESQMKSGFVPDAAALCESNCNPAKNSTSKRLRDLAEVIEGFFQLRRLRANLATAAVAAGEGEQVVVVGRLLQPPPGPSAKRAIEVLLGLHMVLDEPACPVGDEAIERFEPRGHVIVWVDRLAHVVQERREQELLVVGE